MNSKILKVLFSIAIAFLLIYGIARFYKHELLSWSILNDKKLISEINNEFSIYSSLNSKADLTEELSIIENGSKEVKSLLSLSFYPQINIAFQNGDCSGKTIPEANLILLNFCNHRPTPFIHEYIHALLGLYDELWFTEGFATFLSLQITEKSKLKNILDQNEFFFFNSWYRDKDTKTDWNTRTELTYIEDLTRKYKRKEIRELLKLNSDIEFHELKNEVEFYRLSASFCEHIGHKIGNEKLINLAKEKLNGNTSILSIFKKHDINIENMYNEWLLNFAE